MGSSEADRPIASRDGWVSLGIAVSAVSAGFSSFAGLRGLAAATGWGAMAPLFALCIDAYALTAIRIWPAGPATASAARRFAKRNAIGAILLSLAGNAIWHLIAAGLLAVTWPVVVAVGGVPPVILGTVTHLAVLRRQVEQPPAGPPSTKDVLRTPPASATKAAGRPSPRPPAAAPVRRGPTTATGEELLAAAREADARYRREHDGRPITRDALRQSLHIGGQRATELLRTLRASPGNQPLSIPHQERS